MKYTFIVYEDTLHTKPKTFEMLLVDEVSVAMNVVRKITGPAALETALNPHALFEIRKVGATTVRPAVQWLYDPVNIANNVFMRMVTGLGKKQRFLVNFRGGYQTFDPAIIESLGWKEVRREQREQLSFNKYENK